MNLLHVLMKIFIQNIFHDFSEYIQVTELNKSADSGWTFFSHLTDFMSFTWDLFPCVPAPTVSQSEHELSEKGG